MIKWLLIIALFLSGCAADTPYYLEAGLGMRVDRFTDPLLHTETENNGRNPTFEIAWGRRFELFETVPTRCELYHWSHLRDGGPFNDNAEQYELRWRCLAGIPLSW